MVLALFDFDGTISNKDSLTAFLKFIQPNKCQYFFMKYILCFHKYALYKFGVISTEDLKKNRLKIFFKKKSYFQLIDSGRIFADSILPTIIKQSAIDAIELHLSMGHDVYVVSASLDIILKPWCEQRKIHLITNELDSEIKSFNGVDCNGNEKVVRIKKKIDLSQYDIIYAYGDTAGDRPMLGIAHKKYYQVFK